MTADVSDSFRPFPLLSNPHLQTVLATARFVRSPPSRTELVLLPDGDKLALEVSSPPQWCPEAPTVFLVHGLCGCHGSPYLVRMARKLYRHGIRAVRVNMRGCGSGRGLARGIYHSGRSEDVLEVIRSHRERHPSSATTLIGFSLGGNIALKLVGELHDDAPELLDKLIAVCPPADLAACARKLSEPRNVLYDRHFVFLLRRMVHRRHRDFPDLGEVELPAKMTLWEFDDIYTARFGGFRDARDYYERSSAAPLAPRIKVDTHILFADDDPFIDATALSGYDLGQSVRVIRSRHGGHLGFLGIPGRPGGYRWMDAQLLKWMGFA